MRTLGQKSREAATGIPFCNKLLEPHEMSRLAKAIEEMVRQVREAVLDERGMMQKGVIVRLLVLPGHLGDSKGIVRYMYETYGDRIYTSIMNQYTPIAKNMVCPELNEDLLILCHSGPVPVRRT